MKNNMGCLLCAGGSIGMNPQALRELQTWHDKGHPKSQVQVSDLVATDVLGIERPANPPTPTSINEILEEGICQNCGGVNPVWFAPNEWWNRVVDDNTSFLCPTCFIIRAELKDLNLSAWELIPETKKESEDSDLGNPEGNIGNAEAIIARKHRVSDLATPDSSPITSLSNPQKHALYTLIASAKPKEKLVIKNPYHGAHALKSQMNSEYNRGLQDYDNAIKEVLGNG